jgi:hypothetical protein
MSAITDMELVFARLQSNTEKAKKGNKSAATRARKDCLTLTKMMKEHRQRMLKISKRPKAGKV